MDSDNQAALANLAFDHLDAVDVALSFRFSGALSSRERLPGKTPTAQLTRIDAADRLFSVP